MSADGKSEGLRLKHTLWANCSLAAGSILGLVVYTGAETRSRMSAKGPRMKVGKTDNEVDRLAKLLFCFVLCLAFMMLCLSGTYFNGQWLIYFTRVVLLLSSIIPISLRVNLDFAKIAYSGQFSKEKRLPGVVVRNSSIPEELGRVEYLLSDKTGTLTKNEMIFKKLVTPIANFGRDSMQTLAELISEVPAANRANST